MSTDKQKNEKHQDGSKGEYDTSIPVTDEDRKREENEHEKRLNKTSHKISIEQHFADVAEKGPLTADYLEENEKRKRPVERANEYNRRGYNRDMGRSRVDPFATPGGETPGGSESYANVMKQKQFERDKAETLRQIGKQKRPADSKRSRWSESNAEEKQSEQSQTWDKANSAWDQQKTPNAWDQQKTPGGFVTPGGFTPGGTLFGATPSGATPNRLKTSWSETPSATPLNFARGATPSRTPGLGSSTPGRWAATPGGATPRRWEATPGGATPSAGKTPSTPFVDGSRTPSTPFVDGSRTPSVATMTPLSEETPSRDTAFASTPSVLKRSRWDETPDMKAGSTPRSVAYLTPSQTPKVAPGAFMTPAVSGMTPEQMRSWAAQTEFDLRNLPLSDSDLDALLPKNGYEVVKPPEDYRHIVTPSHRAMATPTPFGATPGFSLPEASTFLTGEARSAFGIPVPQEPDEDLPDLKPTDMEFFAKLVNERDEDALTTEEQKERKIMKLLLKVKNGLPPQRKLALKQITEKALFFGAGPLFNQILPMLMSASLEDQERHLMVKVIDRVLFRLDDRVRPYVHKILVVIEPLLIDEDYFARVEGREIISNLAKAAGLATMISTMRPDIDNIDEYVRNTTARAFSVVASAIGIPSLLPFLRAVCQSKKSWQARHTGIKIVQQISILMGCAILAHLKSLVEIVQDGLMDEQSKVRTICALSLAALAEAAHPYGIESFDGVLRPLWRGIKQHRGKTLAAFLKAIGYIIPLMDASYANYYTREVMFVLIREFSTPDEEMKKIVLKVVKQCVATDGVYASYVQEEILPEFFRQFWIRRMALDKRNYAQLVETTAELANKVGGAEIIGRIVEDLKDESEPYRKMVLETVSSVLNNLGSADVDVALEEQLVDGVLYCFQEQQNDDPDVMLLGFASVCHTLGKRLKPYIAQILALIKWRLNNKTAQVRQYSADLLAHIAVDLKACGEEKSLGHLGVVLYEYLGEEYPDVLGSILGALKAIVNVIGMAEMTPPIKDLLPRLTPILKNRHEKVQENVIDLVGRIADRGAEYVSPKEWMRICFELLDTLKAHKKAIRRAAVNTFGYIAKAIGPSDVLATLLNNLRVQERQNRVCTTVAIAIVAETCSPFTVLPALMNEYRVREINVQNGVLKSLAFLFEYIGEMSKDYVYSILPLLEDALTDRDLVHRQTTCTAVKHIALGCVGQGVEDAMHHLLNLVFPNLFETSPHMINAVTEALDGMRLAVGPGVVILYLLHGLFHPARKVRTVYWRLYNNLYIGSQDALTAFYPDIPSSDDNVYHREELDVFI